LIEPRDNGFRAHGPVASDAQARKSAYVVAAVLAAIAAWNLYRGRTTTAAVTGGVALSLALVGALWATGARRFHSAWMRLAVVLGYINSRVLLALMYYGVFTPYGLVSRLARRDPLRRRGPRQQSYWVERKTTRQAREQFERLF
jgi:hypothetical protein